MKYIFWQNVLSIHQSAFIRNLAEDHDVTLIAEQNLDHSRKEQGWNIPDFGKTKIFIIPPKEQIDELLSDEENVHIFTGILAFKFTGYVFKLAIERRLKIGVMLEPFEWAGINGILRFAKYYLLRLKYGRYIDFILAIGSKGRWCYEMTGYGKEKIYDWGYFTEFCNLEPEIQQENLIPSIIFVGRIDENKNIFKLVSTCKKLGAIDNLTIIGTGPLEEELKVIINGTNCIYKGNLPNGEVREQIATADVLVLPSRYDGWGAVVNEALMSGTPVIVSDNCGSSILVNGNRGQVFSIAKDNLESILQDFLKMLPYNKDKRKNIKDWAETTISGRPAAVYFMDIIHNVYENKKRPMAPWVNN